MRLLVISHTPHYYQDGRLVGWGPTVRELDQLATLSQELIHIAPCYKSEAPAGALPYKNDRVKVRMVQPAGGHTLLDKFKILSVYPHYLKLIAQEVPRADIIHVRCPANISLLALIYLTWQQQPVKRWYKYAGNWRPMVADAPAYRLQRWWLKKRWAGGKVTVNGRWPGQPAHIHSFLNPSLNDIEFAEANANTVQKRLGKPLQLLFVGRAETAKGVGQVLRIVASLKSDVCLDIIGDGPERNKFEALAKELQIEHLVTFHGWRPRGELSRFYEKAHFILLPSKASEGWPKVLSEAMAYGAVPLASDISSIPQILADFGTGRAHPPENVAMFVASIRHYLENPEQWLRESQAGKAAAYHFTYQAYLSAVQLLFASMDSGQNS